MLQTVEPSVDVIFVPTLYKVNNLLSHSMGPYAVALLFEEHMLEFLKRYVKCFLIKSSVTAIMKVINVEFGERYGNREYDQTGEASDAAYDETVLGTGNCSAGITGNGRL